MLNFLKSFVSHQSVHFTVDVHTKMYVFFIITELNDYPPGKFANYTTFEAFKKDDSTEIGTYKNLEKTRTILVFLKVTIE